MKPERLEPHVIDKTGWPPGPWHNEPDRVDFEHAGYACMILRNGSGALCGYVGVDETHPDFGKHYNDLPFSVHGGLTYSDLCSGHICHVPKPGMPDRVWWLGFDCNHYDDFAPGSPIWARMSGVYRDIAYVTQETKSLAEQLRYTRDIRGGRGPDWCGRVDS